MYNLLEDPLPRLIWRMAVPASLGYLFNTLFNLIDTYFAGQLSTEALAALSASFPVFLLTLGICMGFNSGAGALIANAIGENKDHESHMYHAQAIGLVIIVMLVVAVLFLPFLPLLFSVLGVEGEVNRLAVQYASVIIGGSVFFAGNVVMNAGLAARGLNKYYRNVLIVAVFVNIGLDPLLMFGLKWGSVTIIPAMGVAGIALATILVQMGASVYMLHNIRKHKTVVDCGFRAFIPRKEYVTKIVQQSIPAIMNFFTMSLGTIIILYFLGRFGTNPIAAYGSALRIEQIGLLPSIGLNIALASLVGQNNGARQYDRVYRSYRLTLFYGFLLMLVIVPTVLIFSRSLMTSFSSNAEVVFYGRNYIFVQAITYYSYIILFQSNAVLQGIKQPGAIFWVGLSRQILGPMAIFPLLIFLFRDGVIGVWWGILAVNWSAAIVTWIIAHRKLRKIAGVHVSTPTPDTVA